MRALRKYWRLVCTFLCAWSIRAWLSLRSRSSASRSAHWRRASVAPLSRASKENARERQRSTSRDTSACWRAWA
eukprot:scaffold228005_cov22-Tisochrysis_lutea.AAC.2